MTLLRNFLYPAILCAALASPALAQPEAPPKEPFKAVHLMNLTAAQEAKYMAAVQDFNRGFVKDGCGSCIYHVFKVGKSEGAKYGYMMVSDWPGRDMYVKLHSTDDYKAAGKRNPIMSDVRKTEYYDRFVEAK